MILLRLLVLTLTLCEVIVGLDALTCPKGERVVRTRGGRDRCEGCHGGSYQPEENDSLLCKACTNCEEKSGSVFIRHCTKEIDAKCQCRGDFTPSDSDSSTCKCDIGFGLNKQGECLKCEDGYFSTSINSPCQKWKDLASERPHGGAHTETHTTTTTTSTPRHSTIPKNRELPPPSDTGNHTGTVLLIFGIAGLLALTAVTCKLHTTPRMETQPAVQKDDSLCRRPVEESGADILSPLKLNQGRP